MKILIHAVAAKSGGAETHVRNLAGELARSGKGHRYLLYVPVHLAKELAGRWDNISVIGTDIGFKPKWRRFLWDQWTFRKLAEGADRIFLAADFGPLFPPCPQVLMIGNALLFSPFYAEKILPTKALRCRLELSLRRWLVSLVVKHSAAVTTPSQSMLDDIRRFIPIPEGKAIVNLHGVSTATFMPTPRPVLGGPLRLLHVSEYGEYKNLTALLKAIPLIRNSGVDDFHLTTTANPSQFPDVELATRDVDKALLADPLIAPHVRVLGRIPDADIPRLYQEHDVLIHPSIAAESFGFPLVEAMASGLPVLASNIATFREICGDSALYFDPEDPGDLARKLVQLRNDAALRTRLSASGRARAQERFSWKRHVGRLLEVIEQAGAPEVRSPLSLLLELTRPRSDPRETVRDLLRRHPRLDWDSLYAAANQHRMVGILAPRLLEGLDGSFPPEARSRWISRWRVLAMQDLAQKAALQELLAAAQSRGIRPMLLKGLAVQARLYPGDAPRGARDIDILVKQPDLPAFARCLEQAGFVFCGMDPHGQPFPHWTSMLRKAHEAPFHRPSDGIFVDLHGSLCATPLEERLIGLRLQEQLWVSPREITLGQTPCAIPGREEEVLFLCLHLLKGERFVLRNLLDLLRLLDISEPVDWDRLLRLAGETGTGAFAHYAFEMASEISPGVVPTFVRSRLARFAGPHRLFASSLRLDRLLQTHGEDWPNLALRWRGVFFARRPWIWPAYQLALLGKAGLRRMGLC